MSQIAVTSPSFSRNKKLTTELQKYFPDIKLNTKGTRFSHDILIEYIKNATAIIVGLDKIDETIIKQCPNLQFIAKYGVGLDNIDIEACKKYNIGIGWTPGTNKRSVAELSLANILSLLHNSYQTSNQLSQGIWNKNGGKQLSHKTVGIIGVGNIGKELIKLLKPFDCNILANDIINQSEYYAKEKITHTSKDEIYEKADIISIHTPLTPQTQNIINEKTLAKMKHGVIINNTARGGIINIDDMKVALIEERISVAMDVFPTEPPTDKVLLSLPNFLCTPHIAGNSVEAIESMGQSAIKHLINFFEKK